MRELPQNARRSTTDRIVIDTSGAVVEITDYGQGILNAEAFTSELHETIAELVAEPPNTEKRV